MILVFAFVVIGIILAFKGQCNESLNGIIAGIALVEAFVIGKYELSKF